MAEEKTDAIQISAWCWKMSNKAKGYFITFEGADGVGKTTQIALLAEHFRKIGRTALTTREPGGTAAGERVREILLDPACDMATSTEALLYLAVRAEHVDKLVLPGLRDGSVVISDRFSDSTLVYQGIARGLPIETLAFINDFAAAGVRPDLTIVLDAPLDEMLNRRAKRGEADRMEKIGAAFQDTVRNGFLSLAAKYPDRMIVVNAAREIDDIQSEIRAIVEKRMPLL